MMSIRNMVQGKQCYIKREYPPCSSELSHFFSLASIISRTKSKLKYILKPSVMPLWLVYHPPGVFEDTSTKESLAKDITMNYTKQGLPAFFVVVNFVKLEVSDIWVGGEQHAEKPFIRLVINHIAIHQPDDDNAYKLSCARIDKILKPHLEDKGYTWEYHVIETDRRYWRTDGMVPPQHNTEEEKVWARENKAVPYHGAYPEV